MTLYRNDGDHSQSEQEDNQIVNYPVDSMKTFCTTIYAC